MRGCFVTGTDTGVGKTVVSAAIVTVLRARGASVRALKPVITGLDVPPDPVWPSDHVLLASLTGQSPDEVAPVRSGLRSRRTSPPSAPARGSIRTRSHAQWLTRRTQHSARTRTRS